MLSQVAFNEPVLRAMQHSWWVIFWRTLYIHTV